MTPLFPYTIIISHAFTHSKALILARPVLLLYETLRVACLTVGVQRTSRVAAVPTSLYFPCSISYFGPRNRVAKFCDRVGDSTRALRIAAIKKA